MEYTQSNKVFYFLYLKLRSSNAKEACTLIPWHHIVQNSQISSRVKNFANLLQIYCISSYILLLSLKECQKNILFL